MVVVGVIREPSWDSLLPCELNGVIGNVKP